MSERKIFFVTPFGLDLRNIPIFVHERIPLTGTPISAGQNAGKYATNTVIAYGDHNDTDPDIILISCDKDVLCRVTAPTRTPDSSQPDGYAYSYEEATALSATNPSDLLIPADTILPVYRPSQYRVSVITLGNNTIVSMSRALKQPSE